MHNTYIGQLERGEKNSTIECFAKVSSALDITLGELFEIKTSHPKVLIFDLEEIERLLEGRSNKDQRAILSFIES